MPDALRVELDRELPGAPDAVWAWVADHERMREWMPISEVVLRRPGKPDENGLGALRTVRWTPLVYEERITAFKPCERLEWELTEGAPVRDLRGEWALEAGPDGRTTRVHVRLRFRPRVPGTGWWLRRAFQRQLERGLVGLERKLSLGREDRSRIWRRRERRLW